jgi:hypothetical protein
MKNRKREIRTSGSVRDEDGQHPQLLGQKTAALQSVVIARLTVLSDTVRPDRLLSAAGRDLPPSALAD